MTSRDESGALLWEFRGFAILSSQFTFDQSWKPWQSSYGTRTRVGIDSLHLVRLVKATGVHDDITVSIGRTIDKIGRQLILRSIHDQSYSSSLPATSQEHSIIIPYTAILNLDIEALDLAAAASYKLWRSACHCVTSGRKIRRSYVNNPFTSPSTSVVCVQTPALHAYIAI